MLLFVFIVTIFISLLTFYSGFGLGTLLTPVMMLFFPFDVAIALTGIVHLFNNILKFVLVKKHINSSILLRFGIPAIVFAFIGSSLLLLTTDLPILYSYELVGKTCKIEPMKLMISILLFVFTLMDFLPRLKNLSFDHKYLAIGGSLSGFFGGLSGNQGALRTIFLRKAGLTKEQFIATGVAISTVIDCTRIGVYSQRISDIDINPNLNLLIYALLGALIGTWIGNRLLKKISLNFINQLTAIFLMLISVFLGLGIA